MQLGKSYYSSENDDDHNNNNNNNNNSAPWWCRLSRGVDKRLSPTNNVSAFIIIQHIVGLGYNYRNSTFYTK